MYPEYPDSETWRQIAFSYQQIQDFLSLIALPHYEARKLMPLRSVLLGCFCTGFYFFCWSIREELPPAMAEELINLAIRVEKASTEAIWDQNAEEARRLLAYYFESEVSTVA